MNPAALRVTSTVHIMFVFSGHWLRMVPIRSFGVAVDLLSESGIHVVTILLFCIIGHLQSASILGCSIQFLS